VASVFLSYDRDDFPCARLLAHALEEAGHSVWWDRNIKGGVQYSKEIDQALAAAEAVLVLWSRHSIESAWVRDEAEAGRDLGRLVPACLDGSRPPLGFRQYQTIDLAEWRRTRKPSALDDLLATLAGAPAGATNGRPPGPARKRSQPLSPSRRRFLVGAGAAGAVALGGGGAILYRRAHPPLPPEVETLMIQAKQQMDQASPVAQYQTIGLFQRAVKLLPDYADGWGWLGMAYAIPSHYRERSEAITLRAKAESAGRRALELDAGNVYGEMALAIAKPFVGHWREWDERLTRALAKEPRNDDVLIYRAIMLQFEGRAAASVPLYERIAVKPLKPAVYRNYIQALWTAGRLAELDQAMDDAASLYPTYDSIWFSRFYILAYGGRSEAAIALAQNADGRPGQVAKEDADEYVRLAEAIATRDPVKIDGVMATEIDAAHYSASIAEYSVRNASALGRLDDAFAIADAYYFGHGFVIPDYHGKSPAFSPEQRQTRLLFEPVTAPMRADPRFEPLVARLGFDRYWRESGVPPDYRRS
jgi:tetratricopeptide (TPR) repeat protein